MRIVTIGEVKTRYREITRDIEKLEISEVQKNNVNDTGLKISMGRTKKEYEIYEGGRVYKYVLNEVIKKESKVEEEIVYQEGELKGYIEGEDEEIRYVINKIISILVRVIYISREQEFKGKDVKIIIKGGKYLEGEHEYSYDKCTKESRKIPGIINPIKNKYHVCIKGGIKDKVAIKTEDYKYKTKIREYLIKKDKELSTRVSISTSLTKIDDKNIKLLTELFLMEGEYINDVLKGGKEEIDKFVRVYDSLKFGMYEEFNNYINDNYIKGNGLKLLMRGLNNEGEQESLRRMCDISDISGVSSYIDNKLDEIKSNGYRGYIGEVECDNDKKSQLKDYIKERLEYVKGINELRAYLNNLSGERYAKVSKRYEEIRIKEDLNYGNYGIKQVEYLNTEYNMIFLNYLDCMMLGKADELVDYHIKMSNNKRVLNYLKEELGYRV